MKQIWTRIRLNKKGVTITLLLSEPNHILENEKERIPSARCQNHSTQVGPSICEIGCRHFLGSKLLFPSRFWFGSKQFFIDDEDNVFGWM